MKDFTVVLLYPEALAQYYGESYTTIVQAWDSEGAVKRAQEEVVDGICEEFASIEEQDLMANLFVPVFVAEGYIENIL